MFYHYRGKRLLIEYYIIRICIGSIIIVIESIRDRYIYIYIYIERERDYNKT